MSNACSNRSALALATCLFATLCAPAHAKAPVVLGGVQDEFSLLNAPTYTYTVTTLGSNPQSLTADLTTQTLQEIHFDAFTVPEFWAAIISNPAIAVTANEYSSMHTGGSYATLAPPITNIQYFQITAHAFFNDGTREHFKVYTEAFGTVAIVPEPSGALVLLLSPLGFVRKR